MLKLTKRARLGRHRKLAPARIQMSRHGPAFYAEVFGAAKAVIRVPFFGSSDIAVVVLGKGAHHDHQTRRYQPPQRPCGTTVTTVNLPSTIRIQLDRWDSAGGSDWHPLEREGACLRHAS